MLRDLGVIDHCQVYLTWSNPPQVDSTRSRGDNDQFSEIGGALIRKHKLTLSEVKFEIDNWPKVADALYCEPELARDILSIG